MFHKSLKSSSFIINILFLQIICGSTFQISSYSTVSTNNTGVTATEISNETAQSRQITKGNSSLIEKLQVLSEKEDNLNEKSTGRAFQNNYPYPSSFFSKPTYSNFPGTNNNNNVNEKVPRYIVYPAYTPNDSNIDQAKRGYDKVFATDRFAPGEAYSASLYPLKKAKKEAIASGNKASGPAANVSPSNALSVTTANNAYIPPKDLFAFPPNIQSAYLPPNAMQSQNPVTSYLPPPSGQVDTPPAMNYPGPINPDLMHDPHDHKHDHGPDPNDQPMDQAPPTMMAPMMTAPGAPMMTGPDMMSQMGPYGPPMNPHDHNYYSGLTGVDSYPEVIYDEHDHFHHHHDHAILPPPPPPAEPPKPDPPEEPRVKKYSYYYLGRKLWYIPLYFTLWFCLYVTALIIRSIGRHKVDYPNHYQARGARSIHDLSHRQTVEKINKMTSFAMTQIEDFMEKYL